MSKESNKEILKKYLIKENIKYKSIIIAEEEIIELDLANMTQEQKDNLFKEIHENNDN